MSFVENIKESYNELVHKVSWPTRKELAQSSVIGFHHPSAHRMAYGLVL